MLSRHFRLYLAVALLSAILMTFQGSHGPLRPFAAFARGINSINSTITFTFSSLSSTLSAISAEKKETKRLDAEVRDLKIKLMDRNELLKENLRLREMLAFKISEPRQVAIATVISRSSLRWSSSLIIDKGKVDGVKKDMAVITPDGLVGKIHDARPYYSIVLLITDLRFSAAVRIHETREEAILSGLGSGGVELKYLDRRAVAKEGHTVLTSGLDALFPHGVPVAKVKALSGGDKELFYIAKLQPLAQMDKLEEVIVIER
jgi:rod shape-determining protein MreC